MKGRDHMSIRVKKSIRKHMKICCIAGVVMIAAIGMTSCGSSKNNNEQVPSQSQTAPVTLDVKDVATKILNGGSFGDELNELDASMFEVVYQDVDMSQVVSKYAYTNSGASAEQIAVVEAKDSKAAEDVKAAMQLKLNDDIDANKDYLPNEIPKLQKPVLKVIGNYVILCVSNDNAKVEEVINQIN